MLTRTQLAIHLRSRAGMPIYLGIPVQQEWINFPLSQAETADLPEPNEAGEIELDTSDLEVVS